MIKFAQTAGILAGLLVVSPPVQAQNLSPQIVVPERPGGGSSAGCYRIDGDLYGPYTMSFCLGASNSQKTYRVRGGGLDCRGRLDWYESGRGRLQINLRQSSCGRGQAWSADTLTCNFGNIGNPQPYLGAPSPQVVIPDRNYGNVLRCNYVPSVDDYPPASVTARRIG